MTEKDEKPLPDAIQDPPITSSLPQFPEVGWTVPAFSDFPSTSGGLTLQYSAYPNYDKKAPGLARSLEGTKKDIIIVRHSYISWAHSRSMWMNMENVGFSEEGIRIW